jgi:hypothetical protein
MSQYSYIKQQLAPINQAGVFLAQHASDLITLHEAVDLLQLGVMWLDEADHETADENTITQETGTDSEPEPQQSLTLTPKVLCRNQEQSLVQIANQILPLLEDPYLNEKTRMALVFAYNRLKESATKYRFVALFYERLDSDRGLSPQYN